MSPIHSLFLGGLILSLLPTVAAACPERPPGVDEKGKLTLKLPRRPAAREAVRARLKVGLLPRGARIIVRAPDGKIAASITPFGVPKGQAGGVQTIPVPPAAVEEDRVSLRLEVQEKGAARPRVPTRSEVESVKLEIIPVATADGK